jgi:hypothetical protein
LPFDAFWRQTPRSLAIAMIAARRRAEGEHNARAWLAWHVAALSRMPRLPRLDRLTIHHRRKQTWREQLAIVRMITSAYGGK